MGIVRITRNGIIVSVVLWKIDERMNKRTWCEKTRERTFRKIQSSLLSSEYQAFSFQNVMYSITKVENNSFSFWIELKCVLFNSWKMTFKKKIDDENLLIRVTMELTTSYFCDECAEFPLLGSECERTEIHWWKSLSCLYSICFRFRNFPISLHLCLRMNSTNEKVF